MPTAPAATREAIGYRIARIRDTAGLTQQQLADRIGKTKQYVSLVENGHRPITRRARLIEFANALGVPITSLTGQPYEPTSPFDLEHHLIIPQIRMALDEPDEGPVRPRSLADLDLAADRAMAARMDCDIATLGQYLPSLIAESRVLWFEHGDRTAGELLVKAAVTGSLALKAAGWVDIGIRLADLADTVATSLGDPVCRAAAAFSSAQAALAVGSRKRSARVAIAGAEELERLSRTKLPANLLNDIFAWMGVLHLHAALSVAALENSDPEAHIAEARALARRVTGDPWRMEFSAANVGTWAVGIALENGHPEQAPALARQVNPNELVTKYRRSRLYLDTGRALYVAGDQEAATRALLAADREAPGDLRTRASAVEIVAQMVRDAPQHGGSEALRDLAVKVGVNPFAPDPIE